MTSIPRARAVAALAALGIAAPLGARSAGAAERVDAGDVGLLNAAMGLERAAIKIYADAVTANLLSAAVAGVTNQFSADHAAHLSALVALVQQAGQTPSNDTTAVAVPVMKAEADVLAFALGVERQLASTYLAAVPQYKNREYAKTAAAILGVDTTHVALLAEALRQNPAYPGGFTT